MRGVPTRDRRVVDGTASLVSVDYVCLNIPYHCPPAEPRPVRGVPARTACAELRAAKKLQLPGTD